MTAHLLQIGLIIGGAILCNYANDKLNNVPVFKTIIQVLIVVAAVVLLGQSLGLIRNYLSVN